MRGGLPIAEDAAKAKDFRPALLDSGYHSSLGRTSEGLPKINLWGLLVHNIFTGRMSLSPNQQWQSNAERIF